LVRLSPKERHSHSLTHTCLFAVLLCCPILPPPLHTPAGELYYEGKEYEAQLEHLKPGVLSDELREALGMDDNSPPPWLVNMQVRVGGSAGGRSCCVLQGVVQQQKVVG
jgi:hypothetical protein